MTQPTVSDHQVSNELDHEDIAWMNAPMGPRGTQALTQEQLNAGVIIRALSDLLTVNTNPQFGYGADTLSLVRNHVRHWDWHNKREAREVMLRLLEAMGMPLADPAVDPAGELAKRDPTTRDESSSEP